MEQDVLLAVDIGNTQTVFGLYRQQIARRLAGGHAR